jgi:hypothetical protein
MPAATSAGCISAWAQAQKVRLRVQWPHGGWGPWQEVAANGFYVVDRQSGTNPWRAP